MYELAKINQKQADAINFGLYEVPYYKNRKDKLLGEHYECTISNDGKTWSDGMEALNEMTFDQLAIALYVGYEIET